MRCGTEFHDFGGVFAEQDLICGKTIEHFYHCDFCWYGSTTEIRGPRLMCLDCVDWDFCASCYASWVKSSGEMGVCKGTLSTRSLAGAGMNSKTGS